MNHAYCYFRVATERQADAPEDRLQREARAVRDMLKGEMSAKAHDSIFKDDFDPDFHVEITLSISECRRILRLLAEVQGKQP